MRDGAATGRLTPRLAATVILASAFLAAATGPAAAQESPPGKPPEESSPPPRESSFELDPDLIGHRPLPDRFEFHGRASAEQRIFQDEELVDQTGTRASSIGEFALFAGFEFNDRLRALAEVEFGAILGDELGDQTFDVDQARVEWQVLRDGKLALSGGRFYVPFGIERFSYSSPRNKLVDRPAPFRRIFPGTYSDTGAMVEGSLPFARGMRVRYEAAATFGLGNHVPTAIRDARQDSDNNNEPQVSGRIGIDLGHDLELGGSALRGRWDDDAEQRIEMYGLDAVWKPDPFDVRAEWILSRAEQPGDDVRRRGFYAQASVHLPFGGNSWIEEVEPAMRIDWIRANQTLPDAPRVRRLAAGLNVHLAPNMNAKLQYELVDDGRLDTLTHGILAQLSLHW